MFVINGHSIFGKLAARLAVGVLGVAAMLPFAAYIPWVQNALADIACDVASDRTGKDISVGDVRVRFPLDVTATDVMVRDPETGDTLFKADEVRADVAPGPLLDGKVQADSASISGGKSQIKTDDGSVDLDVDLDHAKVRGANVDLKNNKVEVADAKLRGGKAKLNYKPEKKKNDPDKTPSKPWKVNAGKVTADDVDYEMEMKPEVDHLDAHVDHAEARDVAVDTGDNTVHAGSLNVDGADVDMRYPDKQTADNYRKQHPLPDDTDDDSDDDKPWDVKVDNARLTNGHGTYAQTGKQPPKPGGDLDPDYIEADDVELAVDDFESKGSDVKVPVKHVAGKERSGLEVKDGSGTITKNDKGLDLDNVHLKTKGSDIALDGHVDQDMLDGKPNGKATASTDSKIDLNEVEKLVPEARKALKDIPHNKPVKVKGKASGNKGRVDVQQLDADVPGVGRVRGKGTIYNPTDPDRLRADLDTELDLTNPKVIENMLDPDTRKQVNLPPMKLRGKLKKDGCNLIADHVTITTGGGKLSGSGRYSTCDQSYDIDATANNFPVKSFLPDYDVTGLTASIKARGQGFDFTHCGAAWTDASVRLTQARYDGTTYRNINANANLRDGRFTAAASSDSPGCDLDATARGTMCEDHYVFTADGDIRDLDLHKLGLTNGTCDGKGKLHATGDINLRTQVWDADVTLNDLDWALDSSVLVADEANATLHSTPSLTCFTFENEDNYAHLNAYSHITDFVKACQATGNEIAEQWHDRAIDMQAIKHPMPRFDMDMHMGTDGLVQRYLQQHEVDFRDLSCEASNDSNLNIDGRAHGIAYGTTNIDTLTLHAQELNQYLAFRAHMGNRRGTWDEFAQVDVEGGVKGSAIDFLTKQRNINGEMGYRLGCNAHLAEDLVKMRFFPQDPIIGYRQWSINSDNYVNVDYVSRMLDANLLLRSDSSEVELITSRNADDSIKSENIQLNIENLKLEEWIALVPALKETQGTLDANIDVTWDGTNVDGDATVNIEQLVYKGRREGNVSLDADFDVDPLTASTRLTADLISDDRHVATIEGTLNDATTPTPLHATASFDRFPLRKANPFIPGGYVWLDGYAVGEVNVTGALDSLVLNGTVTADSATLNLPRYGSSLKLDTTPIPIKDNYIALTDYRLLGANGNDAIVNGYVDMSDPQETIIDLSLSALNVQFMDSEQNDFNEIFGKGLANVDATVKSNGDVTKVRADATLLAGSNLTYVMKDEITQLTQEDDDMVTFTDFSDPDAQALTMVTAKGSSATDVIVFLTVQQGAKINVFMDDEGQNRATVDGSGRLKYSLDFAGKDNLTGTYTIESGNLRYTPPLISQKNFDINSGSSLVWTGDMYNPQLSLTGNEKLKTSVTSEDEGTRLVEFLIKADVGGTLNNMKLDFDLSTESDITVQNELQSMSDNQRSQAAINLLLYNTYSGTNSAGTLNNLTASAALFSFLQSQLNSWAAKTLPGVELSFGINQYDGSQETGGVETTYSYRLAKSLFNDRFKIVVGGEYNTAVTNEEKIADNLFNDVSLEYYLNSRGSRYVRLFRHSGYQNVLEGQVTETGVAFVLKQKLSNLKNLFTFKHSREYLLRDSLEKARKEQLKLQEGAIDAIQQQTVTADPVDETSDNTTQRNVDKPTVTRKDDESNNE